MRPVIPGLRRKLLRQSIQKPCDINTPRWPKRQGKTTQVSTQRSQRPPILEASETVSHSFSWPIQMWLSPWPAALKPQIQTKPSPHICSSLPRDTSKNCVLILLLQESFLWFAGVCSFVLWNSISMRCHRHFLLRISLASRVLSLGW